MDRLTKRSNFYFPRRGEQMRRKSFGKELNTMRRITAIFMALAMTAALTACGSSETPAASTPAASTPAASTASGQSVPSGVEDGVLTVAMECAYAPYNWAQPDDANGAVPIVNSDSGEYANGYDVMMAKKLCEATAGSWKSCVLTGTPWCLPSRPARWTPSSPVSP